MNKNKEVVQLLVDVGTVACSDKIVYTINGMDVVKHAANIAKLQDLINKIDQGVYNVEEKEDNAAPNPGK